MTQHQKPSSSTKPTAATNVSTFDPEGSPKNDRFNIPWNCNNEQEPNWKLYDWVEVHPVSEYVKDGTIYIERWYDYSDDPNDISFWTVYGHLAAEFPGGIYALQDCATEDEARQVARFCEKKILDLRKVEILGELEELYKLGACSKKVISDLKNGDFDDDIQEFEAISISQMANALIMYSTMRS